MLGTWKYLTILQLPREREAGGKRAQKRKGLVITRRSRGQASGKFRGSYWNHASENELACTGQESQKEHLRQQK